MADPPLLTSIALVLPTKLKNSPFIAQSVNQLLLPPTIDAAVYLDLQRLMKAFGGTSQWTVGAMDGAAARGRLDIVQWLHSTRSEGCSSAAFNEAATNNHLSVLQWLCDFHKSKCNATEAVACAAGAGHLEVVKYLRTQNFMLDYAVVLETAARKEQISVLEYLLASEFVVTRLALAAAAKNGLTQVVRALLRGSQSFNSNELHKSRALEFAAAGGHVDVVALLIQHCYGYWGKQCKAPALLKAAEGGHLAVVVMLEPRCKASAIGEALGIAIAKGHDDMKRHLIWRCPAAELAPAMAAAADKASADKTSLQLLEWAIAERERKKVRLDDTARTILCSSFRSAALRGSEKIAILLLNTLLSAWEDSIQRAICTVLVDAASHSKYELMKGILDAMKARQLCFPPYFTGVVFNKASESKDVAMVGLLVNYCQQGVLELKSLVTPEQVNISGQLKKKQRQR